MTRAKRMSNRPSQPYVRRRLRDDYLDRVLPLSRQRAVKGWRFAGMGALQGEPCL